MWMESSSHGGGVKECTARLLCHTLHLSCKTFGDLNGFRLEAAEGAVCHIRPDMDGRDHQHLRGRIIGRIGIGLDQVQQLGHSLPDAPGIVLEVVLHIVGAQHQDDQIQRVVAGKAHRQTGAAIAAQIDGVFKHSGAAAAALLNDSVRRAKGQLQPPGPAHVIRVASAVQGKAEGVAIAIAQDIFHAHSLPFHCLHSVLRLFWGDRPGLQCSRCCAGAGNRKQQKNRLE